MEVRKPKEVTSFIACLPSSASALSMDGQGATRIRFEVPESELPKVVKLAMLTGRTFKVVILAEPQRAKKDLREPEVKE